MTTSMKKVRLKIWAEELIAHTIIYDDDSAPIIDGHSVSARAIIQATDEDGNNWTGDRVIRIKLKKDV